MMTDTVEMILDFWFADAVASAEALNRRAKLWFRPTEAFDREIQRNFGALPERALRGELDAWLEEARSALALILVLDQFPRNLFRSTAQAFSFDGKACTAALAALEAGFDRELDPLEASFLYLPLEHAEDLPLQNRAVELFERLAGRALPQLRPRFEAFAAYARRHREVIRRFGRFPHRNTTLGRPSTAEELSYLESGGDTFGGYTHESRQAPERERDG